eukprot:1490953-Rhodomonas_salina.1
MSEGGGQVLSALGHSVVPVMNAFAILLLVSVIYAGLSHPSSALLVCPPFLPPSPSSLPLSLPPWLGLSGSCRCESAERSSRDDSEDECPFQSMMSAARQRALFRRCCA